MNGKEKVLDVTCGSRMMWFDKKNALAVYCDKRRESYEMYGRKWEVDPDICADWKALPFDNNTFSLVVFDPPHLTQLGEGSWMYAKYGKLYIGWEAEIAAGFDECMRVLKPDGVLIFKWSEVQVPVSRVLDAIPYKPLFGHPSGKAGKTIWMAFIKEQ